jgi:pyridoxal phosphate phosphatase PHOSPHO2
MCKGLELQKLIDAQSWEQVIYMGDSTNDFCPSTRLQSKDVVLARRDLLLQKEITENPHLVNANVIYWNNAKDVLKATQSILGSTLSLSMPLALPTPAEILSPVESSDSKARVQAVRA